MSGGRYVAQVVDLGPDDEFEFETRKIMDLNASTAEALVNKLKRFI